MNCPLCTRVELTKQNKYSYLVHEFEHSYLMLGEHQFYEGYCVLVLKKHFREMTDIPVRMRDEFFQEMMTASEVIQNTFKPTKMNMCSLGNVVDHIHWHFFPRYEADPDFKNPPWLQMHRFDSAKTSPEQREQLIKKLKSQMTNC
jgi:diadenosine tetraphosphate (Ap4A) HIT family hydrolase